MWKEPECFIKGLIDSDGSYVCRQQTINGVTYSRYKYQFTNKSLDIVDMYLKVMARLDISAKPTQKKCGTFNIFTNAKHDVEKLDKLYEIAENKIRSCTPKQRDMAELVDPLASNSSAARRVGSIPTIPTTLLHHLQFV